MKKSELKQIIREEIGNVLGAGSHLPSINEKISKTNATSQLKALYKIHGKNQEQKAALDYIEANYQSWPWYMGVENTFGDINIIVSPNLEVDDLEELIELMRKWNTTLTPTGVYDDRAGLLKMRLRDL